MQYDKNGNITRLKRKGHIVEDPDKDNASDFGLMDDLHYYYNGNQLHSITEVPGTSNIGFNDVNTSDNSYTTLSDNDYIYDDNGNLIEDKNKEITITYNHFNLPNQITFTGSLNNITYIYDATGNKLQKIVNNGTTSIKTNYAGNFIYNKIGTTPETLLFFSQPEGYVEPDGIGGFDYVYQYKDHLGNVRLTYSDSDGDGSIRVDSNPMITEIKKETNYYPFGLEHKGYNKLIAGTLNNRKQFQGQEFTKDLNLNIHEWKFRFSDPAIGRFWQIDPLADDYVFNGTYNFSENRVIDAIELEGLESQTLYEIMKWVSPIAINFSGSYGTERKGIGVNFSVGLPQFLPYSVRKEYGASYYANDLLQEGPVVETRTATEQSILHGLLSHKTTNFGSGDTSQTIGEIRIGGPLINIKTSNDVEYLHGDNGDRYRTAALQFNFGIFSAGFNLGTGDPGLLGGDRIEFFGAGLGENGTYGLSKTGTDPNKYGLGIGYFGVGPFKFGINSEELIRKPIQHTIHDLDVLNSPYFNDANNSYNRFYFEYSFGGSTLWD